MRRFAGGGGRWQVSTTGAFEPHWSPDGRSLYYRQRRDLMRVAVATGPSFAAGAPERVTTGLQDGSNPRSYAVAPDGRILFLQVIAKENVEQPVLVLGFARELETRQH